MEERRRSHFDDRGLIVDGRAVRWWAATLDYARTPRAHWRRALAELRAIGILIVEAPVAWGAHERRAGGYDWSGPLDLGAFLDDCDAANLFVALDLSPMTDGERRLGGLPERIVRDEGLWARSAHGGPAWIPQPTQAWPLPSILSERFHAELAGWYAAVGAIVAPRAGARGPVCAVRLDAGLAHLVRGGAFDLDYHPDALAAWRAEHAGDPPRAWSPATAAAAAAWVRWKGEAHGRALARMSAALDDAGLAGLARYGSAPPIDPTDDALAVPWPRVLDLASGTWSPAAVRRRAIATTIAADADPATAATVDPATADPAATARPALLAPMLARVPAGSSTSFTPTTEAERRALELTALAAGATGLTWTMGVARDRWIGGLVAADGAPTGEGHRAASVIAARARLPALRRRVDVALVVSRADARHGAASSLVDPVPPAALALLGLGPGGAAELADDAEAALAHRWFDAVARALDLAQVAWTLADERADLIALDARAFVVPTLTRVDRGLWRQLHRLAADRRVIVYGPTAPTLDELGAPLAGDLAPPRRAGTMRAGSLDDVPGLAADLAALAARDEWTVERPTGVTVDLFDDDAGQVRALFVSNPGPRPVRAVINAAAGAALRDAFDDHPLRLDGTTVTVEVPGHGVRWLAVSW